MVRRVDARVLRRWAARRFDEDAAGHLSRLLDEPFSPEAVEDHHLAGHLTDHQPLP